MRSMISLALAACAVVAISSQALAQTPPPATAPAAVPEKMPFDIPYGMSIGLEQAKQLVAAAEAEAKKHNWKMNIAV
ncbi:MAG: heme-binding protein, partial [Bradyrhizobium sp.]